MRPEILVRVPYPDAGLDLLREEFTVHYAPTPAEVERAVEEAGERISAVVTNGVTGLSGDHMRRMPALRIVLTRGVGFENVDLPTARELGLTLANGHGVNSFSVAEHAMALLLSLTRDIKAADNAVRAGAWTTRNRILRPLISGKRMGILGLGDIGAGIADRARGFGVRLGYHNRTKRDDFAYDYFPTVLDLAAASDILVVSCPGGAATRGLVNAEILDALGPSGFLVNVARGSVVDTNALVLALREGRIAGAALDVVEGEPVVGEAVLQAPNLIITPHIGSRSPESSEAAILRVRDNLRAHYAGHPVASRVL